MELEKILHEALKRNIVRTKDGPFVAAGRNQFRSFWTRDFCFAAPGLLLADEFEVAKHHTLFLVTNRTEEGLVPRLLDVDGYRRRILKNTLFRWLPFRNTNEDDFSTRSVKISILGEHGTAAFDSNLLVILTLINLDNHHDSFDIHEYKKEIIHLFEFYEPHLDNNFIKQPKYGDWQDSVKRDGKTSYIQLLYWHAAKELTARGFIDFDTDSFKQQILDTFYKHDDGLFLTMEGHTQFSLDTHLLAIESGFLTGEQAQRMYKALVDSPLWQSANAPGLCTFPDYTWQEKSYSTKWVGYDHYHDSTVWSWLMGKSLEVAAIMDDHGEVTRITEAINNLVIRDGTVREIYDVSLLPSDHVLGTAEYDFSWGIGCILEGLHVSKKRKN